jgi:hypothetical protein
MVGEAMEEFQSAYAEEFVDAWCTALNEALK